jgi:hypothetical protein
MDALKQLHQDPHQHLDAGFLQHLTGAAGLSSSPSSRRPPGMDQMPMAGGRPLLTSSTSSPASTIPATPTTGESGYRLPTLPAQAYSMPASRRALKSAMVAFRPLPAPPRAPSQALCLARLMSGLRWVGSSWGSSLWMISLLEPVRLYNLLGQLQDGELAGIAQVDRAGEVINTPSWPSCRPPCRSHSRKSGFGSRRHIP